MTRHLDWPGLWNARDLGGLPVDGGRVRPGALVRSESPHQLTDAGWAALVAHGVRSAIDLRDPEQADDAPYRPPPAVVRIACPLEEGLQAGDAEFLSWGRSGWLATPLYFAPFLARWPDRCAAAIRAIAHAPPGGVLLHCQKGSDRTGMLVAMTLRLLGALEAEIAADHALTAARLATPRAAALGFRDDAEGIRAVLDREGTDSASVLRRFLSGSTIRDALGAGGLRDEDVAQLRARLVERP